MTIRKVLWIVFYASVLGVIACAIARTWFIPSEPVSICNERYLVNPGYEWLEYLAITLMALILTSILALSLTKEK